MEQIVKLKDIAEALGISVVTVSNALSGKKGVSNSLRESILAKAEELGYKSTNYKKKEKTTETIGVLVPEKYLSVGASFYWAMYQQLVYALSKNGDVCMIEIVEEADVKQNKLPKLLSYDNISGLIIIGNIGQKYVKKIINKCDRPVVLLDICDRDNECDSIMSNNYKGMYKMTKYLIENGHRDIAFYGTVVSSENTMDRYFGYRKALEEANIEFNEEWLLDDRVLPSHEFKAVLPKKMPTAFACSCDMSSACLYDELNRNGYKVPEDISIVGYDNYMYGHSFVEDLTTYDVDMKRMTKVAVDTLMKRIKHNTTNFSTHYINGDIVERNSVKNIKNN